MNEFLVNILEAINSIVQSYGISIIIFTIFIRILIFPLNLKSRTSMKKTQALQPKMQALQKKYVNDKEKLNKKTSELYKKEGINPLSGCLPMLISFPVLILMFGAMRYVANEQLVSQIFSYLSGQTPQLEGFLWIKNLWMPDSPFFPAAPTASMLNQIPADIWQNSFNALPAATSDIIKGIVSVDFSADAYKETVASIMTTVNAMPVYASQVSMLSGWTDISLLFTKISIYANNNGLFILPILAAVTQFMVTQLTPQQPVADGQKGTNQFMKWFFPLFTLFICYSYNASFALYWVTANLFAGVETFAINAHIERKEASKKAISNEEGLLK